LDCKILITIICCLGLPALSTSAFAHKVNIFAYVEGDNVYTESYFPDGKKVKDGKVEVYDSQNKKLLEGQTDNNGQFSFRPIKKDDLTIIINASMGHRSSYVLTRDEFSIASVKRQKTLRKDKISPKDIIAGIGYIFGIAGVAFYFRSKRRND